MRRCCAAQGVVFCARLRDLFHRDPPRTNIDAKRIRILIVDDNPDVRRNLAAVLELAGHSAGVRIEISGQAGDGREGVELAAKLTPDVVLMDLEMPVLDGFEAARRIKSRQGAPRVVILSVHAADAERDRARASGADDFVVKGASYLTLLNAILVRDEATHPSDVTKGETT
jgi:CheY-like chemotaxis protein